MEGDQTNEKSLPQIFKQPHPKTTPSPWYTQLIEAVGGQRVKGGSGKGRPREEGGNYWTERKK